MFLSDEKLQNAEKAGPRLRTALLAECAERAFKVYEETWEGALAPSIARAIEIGWDFALGKTVDAQEVAACLAEIDTHVDFYLDDGNDLPGTYCVLAKRILESLSTSESDAYLAFGRGVVTYIDVANFAEAAANQTNGSQPKRKDAANQERDWSDRAMALIASWPGDAVRDMFASLGPKPPAWVDDWLARKKA